MYQRPWLSERFLYIRKHEVQALLFLYVVALVFALACLTCIASWAWWKSLLCFTAPHRTVHSVTALQKEAIMTVSVEWCRPHHLLALGDVNLRTEAECDINVWCLVPLSGCCHGVQVIQPGGSAAW